MLAPSGSLLRAGIGLKLSQIKIATRSYLRDRTNQATGTMTSYAIAAGLFAAAGIFLIAACLVGTVALYRWIAIHYGQFWGFGAIGALLVTIAAICAGVAAARLRQPSPHFPTLTSRLRVAIKSNPLATEPDRSRARYRGLGPAGAFGAPVPSSRAAIAAGAEQQEHSGRPDRDGDAAGLGGHAAAIERAPNGRLMPRARPEDNLLLMAATAILILTAQHFFQAGTRARSAGFGRRARRLPAARTQCAIGQPARGPARELENHPVAHLRAFQ